MNVFKKMQHASAVLLIALALPSIANAFETKEKGILAAGSDQVFPPYDYLENGVTKGFDADVMALIAPKLGVTVKFYDTRFTNLIPGLQARRYDAIVSALYITHARAQVVDYIPYAKTGGSLLVRSDDSFAPKLPKELCGKRVGSLKGAAWVPELQKVSDAQCASGPMSIREFATSAEAAQALLSRGVDVVFEDAGVAKSVAGSSGNRLRITSDEILFPVVIGIAVRKDNTELRDAIQTAVDEVVASSEYTALLAKYNLAMPTADEIKAAISAQN